MPPDKSREIGARLLRLRVSLGLTQQQIAEQAGVSVYTYRNWEQGIREPLASAVVTLSRVLGVTADELLGMHEPDQNDTTLPAPPKKRGRPKKEDDR